MSNNLSISITKPRFYFLDYFYVLLKSVERYSDSEQIFELFKSLKQEHKLGQSKYKTLAVEPENLSKVQVGKYKYTFEGVIDEAINYGLITNESNGFHLTPVGQKLLSEYESDDKSRFNKSLLNIMETKSPVFRHLIEFLYEKNQLKPGLLIFPIYSPRLLGFDKSMIRKTSDFVQYSEALTKKLEDDIRTHLRLERSLSANNKELLDSLNQDGLLLNYDDRFDPKMYNVITTRFRNFWLNYFLKYIYNCDWSWSSFERLVYRGKQIGIIHATEFHPDVDGKVVYPTSVVIKATTSDDFECLCEYSDGFKLFGHNPTWERNQEKFVSSLVDSYFDLRRTYRSYFVSLPSLRELVCYKLKISESRFELFLDYAYKLNLAGKLAVRISMEVDKLPEETKAMYLTKEPVMIDGKYRNIIAIDVSKRGRTHEQTPEEAYSSR